MKALKTLYKMSTGPESVASEAGDYEIPLDPNLVCPKCKKPFRRGEIRKARRHYLACTGQVNYQNYCSDPAVPENPLIEGIGDDMREAQEFVYKMSTYPESVASEAGEAGDYEIPFDPNLVCPKCKKPFRRGEIQRAKKHYLGCIGDSDDDNSSVPENPLSKELSELRAEVC